MRTVFVARQFSRHPAGRKESDGPFSGQAFRKLFLEPALKKGEKLIVDFEGTRGAGSSFLEEAFGGLVRESKFPKSLVLDLIEVRHATNPSVVREVRKYIEEAREQD
jgi:hypothetical protein